MFDRLIDLIIQFARLFQVFAVLRCYQGGVILRFGKFHRMAKVGVNWVLPFTIDELIHCNIVVETMLVGPQSLVTKDARSVVISTVVTFKVEDPKVFLLEIEGANRVIEDSTFGEVSDWVTERTWQELVESDVANKLSIKLRRRAKAYGVDVQRVQVVDLTPSRSIRLMQSITTGYAPSKEF